MVDLPEPDNPVNHKMQGFCPLRPARASAFTSSACQCTLVARLRPNSIMPAPTVLLVKRSMMMKPPVSRFLR